MINFLPQKVSWMLKKASLRKNSLTSLDHDRSEISRIALCPNTVFNEMWFLTNAPFIRMNVFIAKLFQATILLAYPRRLSLSLTDTVASSCVCTSP